MHSVALEEVESRLLELIEEAAQGKEIIITKCDHPLVKLVAVKQDRSPGSAKGLVHIHDDFDEPLEDFQAYL